MTGPAAAIGDLWLVRHGPTSWTGVRWCGRADPPLTPEGELAAAELAAALQHELPPDVVVVSSPAARARATAAAIAERIRAETTVLDDLVEVDVGRAEGLTWAEVEAREPALAAAIAAGDGVDWPNGESRADLAARAERAAAAIGALAAGRPVVAVAHGAILHAVARLIDPAGHATRAPLEPCGVIRIARPA